MKSFVVDGKILGASSVAAYLTVVLVAGCMAAVRLHQSTDMPGLAAIELVVLALPWSLGLGVPPLSRLGWLGMVTIVFTGIGADATLLWWLGQWMCSRNRQGG